MASQPRQRRPVLCSSDIDIRSIILHPNRRKSVRMPQVFISYRRGPSGYVASLLSEELRTALGPNAVFMDIDNIPFGADFRERLSQAVSECQVLLVVIGDDWNPIEPGQSKRRLDDVEDFVRIEVEAALQRDIRVVPVLTGNATMPAASDLPTAIRPLVYKNSAELRSGRDLKAQMRLLITQVSSLQTKPDTGKSLIGTARPAHRFSTQRSKRSLFIAGICLGVFALVVGLIIAIEFFRSKLPPQSQAGDINISIEDQNNAGSPAQKGSKPKHRKHKR